MRTEETRYTGARYDGLRHVTTRTAGFAIFLLGIWGGLIPFVGPYFNFTLGPDRAWAWTSGRLWLDVVPAVVAVIGGLMLMGSGPRANGRLGALLALLAGIWFAIGPDLSVLWNHAGAAGVAHGGATRRGLETLSFHHGLGVLIAALGAFSLPGRLRRVRTSAGTAAEMGVAAGAGAGAEAIAQHRARRRVPAGAAAAPAVGGATPASGQTGARSDPAGAETELTPPSSAAAGGAREPATARLAADRDLAAAGVPQAGASGGAAGSGDGYTSGDGSGYGNGNPGRGNPGAGNAGNAGNAPGGGPSWLGRITGRNSSRR
jgi:hypothetical protein